MAGAIFIGCIRRSHDAPSIEAFHTDYQKAVENVEFKATYETHRMTVASTEDALRQGMSRGLMTAFLGKGVLYKKGHRNATCADFTVQAAASSDGSTRFR